MIDELDSTLLQFGKTHCRSILIIRPPSIENSSTAMSTPSVFIHSSSSFLIRSRFIERIFPFHSNIPIFNRSFYLYLIPLIRSKPLGSRRKKTSRCFTKKNNDARIAREFIIQYILSIVAKQIVYKYCNNDPFEKRTISRANVAIKLELE